MSRWTWFNRLSTRFLSITGRIVSQDIALKLPEPLLSLTRSCEVHCVAGCCGLDAFDVHADHIIPWLTEHGMTRTWEAADQLSDILRLVTQHRGRVISEMDVFNNHWNNAAECALFLRCWQREIVNAATAVTGQALMDPSWRTSTAVGLAEAIYAKRTFDRLPILADALEDAGCTHPDVLAHCRSDGPHARGCWVVDLILGKS